MIPSVEGIALLLSSYWDCYSLYATEKPLTCEISSKNLLKYNLGHHFQTWVGSWATTGVWSLTLPLVCYLMCAIQCNVERITLLNITFKSSRQHGTNLHRWILYLKHRILANCCALRYFSAENSNSGSCPALQQLFNTTRDELEVNKFCFWS